MKETSERMQNASLTMLNNQNTLGKNKGACRRHKKSRKSYQKCKKKRKACQNRKGHVSFRKCMKEPLTKRSEKSMVTLRRKTFVQVFSHLFFLFLQDQDIQRPTTFQKCPDVSNAKNREYANSPTEMVTKAANQFSKVLYKELRKRNKENLIVSSFSLSTVLAMISPGAKGATLKEVPVSFSSLCQSKTKMHPNPLQRPFPDVVTKVSNF